MSDLADSRSALTARRDGARAHAELKLVRGDQVSTFPLPAEGSLVIGRASDAEVSLDDASLSRRHARIDLGAELRITDLGSANGTVVGGRRLRANETVSFTPGDVIDLGGVMAVVQYPAAVGRVRRVWSPADFEAKLAEECERGEPFAVLRVRFDNVGADVESVLLGCVRAMDSLASYVPGTYHVLLPRVAASDAPALARALGASLRTSGLAAVVTAACFPRDASSSGALIAAAAGQEASAASFVRPASGSAMARVYSLVERVAAGTLSVLLLGETGVGKEVIAEALHRASPRRDRPLLRLNCAALTETLLESELFGHEKGAFTGAVATKPGLIETAHGGTVFLDEIGELPAAAQAKLLRVLEDRKVMRVGSLTPRAVDVRFISATHRDLDAEIANGRFRRDLFFRIAGLTIPIPPLRERTDEIVRLAATFIAATAGALGRAQPALAREAHDALVAYSWPGNVRELRNVIERAVTLCDGVITPADLAIDAGGAHCVAATTGDPRSAAPLATSLEPLQAQLAQAERDRILAALERCGGNQTRAAKELRISRGTLVSRLGEYGVMRPRKKGS